MVTKIIASNDEYAKEIANIIKQQLFAGGTIIVYSWGAHNFMFGVTEDTKEPVLAFDVQGNHFTGNVRIIYQESMDTYRVELVNEETNELVDKIDEAYCDNLTECIDLKVEKLESYAF